MTKIQNSKPHGFGSRQVLGCPDWLALLTIVLFTFVAYLPAISGGFIWDDDYYVLSNTLLTVSDGLWRIWMTAESPQYYPMVFTTFWVEYRLWGLQPMGYHIVNVAIHTINAVLFWLLLRRLRIKGAWLAGAIFALHPVHVESVAWITERKNVLSGMFYLLAIGSYLRFVDLREWRWYVAAFGLFLFALLSKTVTSSLPVVLLFILWLQKRKVSWRDIGLLTPFVVAGLVMGLLTVWLEVHHVGAQGEEWVLSMWQRLLLVGRALWFYVVKLVWPVNLAFIYPRWQLDVLNLWQWVWPLGVVVVGVGLWLFHKRVGRGPIVGLAFFSVTLFPALGFFNVYPMRYSFVADHFQYLASMGLIALIVGSAAWGLDNVSWLKVANILNRRNLVKVSIGFTVLVVLGILTWRQGHIYQDSETLWRDTLTKNSESWLAHNNLGVILKRQGKLEEAIKHFQEALRVRPSYAGTYFNLGLAMFEQGKLDMAVEYYQQALRIEPTFVEAHYKLGIVLAKQGRLDRAIEHYLHALQINPNFVDVHNNLGLAYAERGLLDLAIAEYKEALRTTPDSFYILNNLGLAYKQKNQIEQAITEFKEAIRINPDYHFAHYNLGNAYLIKGLRDMAITEFKEAIKINPRNHLAHYNLGIIYFTEGLLDLAIAEFEEALRVNPAFEEAKENLNRAMYLRGS